MRIFTPLLMLAGIALVVAAIGNLLLAMHPMSVGPVTGAVPTVLAIGAIIALAAWYGARGGGQRASHESRQEGEGRQRPPSADRAA